MRLNSYTQSNGISDSNVSDSNLSDYHFGEGAATLHTFDDTEKLVSFALNQMFEMVGAHAGSFFLWDEYKKALVLKKAVGPYEPQQTANPLVRLRQGISGLVGEKGESILVKNIISDKRFDAVEKNTHYRSSSFISVPLIAHNKLVGVINLTEKKCLSEFTDRDLSRAKGYARHVAVAIENIRVILRYESENDILYKKVSEMTRSLKEQEKLCAVGKLSANLAHELNNPLDAIRRYVNLAMNQALEDSMTTEYLLKAKKGIRRAIKVIRGLLQYSREMHHMGNRTSEVHALMTESQEAVVHDEAFKEIKFVRNYCPESIHVSDCGISLVLENLYRNAAHAMSGSGTIYVTTQRTGEEVEIKVEDTGHGIQEADPDRVFEAFYSTKKDGEGTGIGLTLCREIVEKSGGSIRCENSDKGACFTIRLACQRWCA